MSYLPEMGNRLEDQNREELLLTARSLLAEAQSFSTRMAAVNEIATAINRTLDIDIGIEEKFMLKIRENWICI